MNQEKTTMPLRRTIDWQKVKDLLDQGPVKIVFRSEKEALTKRQMLHQKFYKLKMGKVITKVSGKVLYIARRT